METLKIIGLCGFINSGKSTIAKYLIENYGYTRMSFASAVKDVAAVLYSWDRKMLDGQTPEDRIWREAVDPVWSKNLGKPFTPRAALQQIGQGFRDIVHPNIWVEIVKNKIGQYNKVIFDDVRYVNERNAIKDMGGKLFIVHRANDRGLEYPSDEHKRLWTMAIEDQILNIEPTSLHQSEWDWLRDTTIDQDVIIENSTNLAQLHSFLDNAEIF